MFFVWLLLQIAPTAQAASILDHSETCVARILKVAPIEIQREAGQQALGLAEYRALPEEMKGPINRQLFMENLVLSRTASSGTSSKTFTRSAAEIQDVALRNAAEAFELVQAAARKPLTGGEVADFLKEVNLVFNKGIDSVTSGGKLGKPGELRSYGYLPSDLGLQGAELQAHIQKELREFSDWLARALGSPAVDPIGLAAEAHFRIAGVIKPFHDGSGRTARAAVDLVFLNDWFLDITSWDHYYFSKYPELRPRFLGRLNELRAREHLPALAVHP